MRKFSKLLFPFFVLALFSACGSGSPTTENDDVGDLFGALLPTTEQMALFPKGLGPWASLDATPVPTATPTSVLLSNTPPIGQQGTCSGCKQGQGSPGSCVSWSAAYGLGSYTAGITQGWDLGDQDHLVSAAYLYAWVLNKEGKTCPVGTMDPDYLNFLVSSGAPSAATVAYQANCDYLGGINLGTLSDPDFEIGSWSFVSPQNRDLIRSYLAAGHAVAFAGHLYQGFGLLEGPDVYYGSGPFEVNPTTKKLVGHGMMLIGYDDSIGDPSKGLGAYRIQNSFGTNWGDGGYLWMSYGTFESSILSAYIAEPLAGPISGVADLISGAPQAPPGRVTRAYQFLENGADAVRVSLVFRHQFDDAVELREISVSDPSGKTARHDYRVWHRNGYTHLQRHDGKQFLPGSYQLHFEVGLQDGSSTTYDGEVAVPSVSGSPLPASAFVSGILGGNGQNARIE